MRVTLRIESSTRLSPQSSQCVSVRCTAELTMFMHNTIQVYSIVDLLHSLLHEFDPMLSYAAHVQIFQFPEYTCGQSVLLTGYRG